MASKTAAKKIVVCGGNGFLGSRICKYAVARGWDVTSISRSGEPKWSAVTSSESPPEWSHKVSWERADIFKPATYAPLLTGADYVVHSMGILLEADYKRVVSGQESPIAGLRKAFSQPASSSSSADSSIENPLERNDNSSTPSSSSSSNNSSTSTDSNDKSPQITYESMNRDSALLLARTAADKSASAFLYVSAAGGAPVLPTRYITTKRSAESRIASEFPRMRGIFIRPPFLYDSSRKFTIPMAAMTGVGAMFNSVTGGIMSGFLGAAGTKPLKVDVVAKAAVEALEDESTRGPVEVPELEDLAEKAWRKGML
ncbi:NAD dependent epimerase/dehydratase [Coniella lustricola]|uniref:NAD dependent epimerase/dehydratase n=1 Tax=Coniella lustricola TaxID=2025994 RepID=A0A2T2ZSU8_9PEZI|nr:NAD dependent epimerase/dehydratase [Coniella lustricola]